MCNKRKYTSSSSSSSLTTFSPRTMVNNVTFSLVVVWTLLSAVAGRANANSNASVSTERIHMNSSFLPIETLFKLPSPLPSWPRPPGCAFASGVIDLGGLRVRQVSTFDKIWGTNGGGLDNRGATFFQPSSIPDGYSMLGAYAQPNNKPLFGWVLVGKTDAADGSGPILKQPTDYTLLAKTSQNTAFFWLPNPPNGYTPVGLVVTTSPNKPPLGNIRCVRTDFTDVPETDKWIWGEGNGLNLYGVRPKTRGTKAPGVSVSTFIVRTNNPNSPIPISCLKNKNPSSPSNPNLDQVKALFKAYSPYINIHPDEKYLPSSVNWFFLNGALLYKKGDESHPVRIQPDGSNLPQGGSNDGSYWLDLPADKRAREQVQGGDRQLSGSVYLNVKPVLGLTFTDIQIWIFSPFNGHAVLKFGVINKIPMGQIGEHVGDWEHVTLRISNFNGALEKVYFSQHAGGEWVEAPEVEFRDGNKVVVYSSLNGHASYHKAGLVMLGGMKELGIRDDTATGGLVLDTGRSYSVVAAEGLSAAEAVVGPPWLKYQRQWGPKITYDFGKEMVKAEKWLIGPLRKKFEKLVKSLPAEFFGQEGPSGPNMKGDWNGDEN